MVRKAVVWWMFLGATVVGLLLFGYKALDHHTRGYAIPVHVPLIEELTAAYGALLLLSLIVPRAVDHPLVKGRIATFIAINLAAAALYSVAHTAWNWAVRTAVFSSLGEMYDYGRMPMRFAMEAPMDLVVYASFAGLLVAVRHRRTVQQQRAHALQSDVRLAEAQLHNLRSQLDPHFLFNALNTISSVMYEDLARADEIIDHLSALLRASLRTSSAREVSLEEEMILVDHYFAIIRARFGEKAQLEVKIPRELLAARLPPVAVQPLIENAVRYGRLADGQKGRIEVQASRVDDFLKVEVFDDGQGIRPGVQPFEAGIGLGALRERLSLMYGNAADVQATNVSSGGCVVTIKVPWRTTPAVSST